LYLLKDAGSDGFSLILYPRLGKTVKGGIRLGSC